MSTDPAPSPLEARWSELVAAAALEFDDLHATYPMYAPAFFSEVQRLVGVLNKQAPPKTEAELQERLATLGEVSLAVYRVRKRLS